MSRSLAITWLCAPVALTALFLGCQQGETEPVAQGRKYEAVEDDDANLNLDVGDTTPGPSAPAGDAGNPGVAIPSNAGGTGSETPRAPVNDTPKSGTAPAGDSGSPKTGTQPPVDPPADPPVASTSTAPAPKDAGNADAPTDAKKTGFENIPFRMPGEEGVVMASYEPPKGAGPKELLDHLRKLSRVKLKARTQEQQLAEIAELCRGRILTSEMLMNAQRATLEERLVAVDTKVETLGIMIRMGNPNVISHAMQFAAALKRHPIPELARKGRVLYLSLAAGELENPQNSDSKWVAEEILAIVKEEPPSVEILGTLQSAVGALVRSGEIDSANECGAAIVAAFEKIDSKEIKGMLVVFRDELGLIGLEYASKLEAAMTGKDGGLPGLVKAAETAARLESRGPTTLQVLAQSGQFMEFSGHYDAASKIYEALAAGFGESEEEEIRESVNLTVSHARKRLGVIGKPLALDGLEIIGGGKLDWKNYEGKVVLVDFWATWCVPCLQEIPNIQANYEKYRDRGFEVIGYNLDAEPKQLDAFFKNQKLPWASVLGKDPAKRGFGVDEYAASLGIDGIPFVVLIGRDGNVKSIHVRGPELGKQLQELLGDASDAPKDGAKAPEKP